MDSVVREAIDAAGGPSALARAVGVKPQAVSQWKQIPARRVRAIEKATGIPRAKLRPDLYGDAA